METKIIDEELGATMSATEVAKKFKLDVSVVRRQYKQLGGTKIGGRYRFFERSVVDALLRQNKQEVGRTDSQERSHQEEIPQD